MDTNLAGADGSCSPERTTLRKISIDVGEGMDVLWGLGACNFLNLLQIQNHKLGERGVVKQLVAGSDAKDRNLFISNVLWFTQQLFSRDSADLSFELSLS